MLLQCLNCTSEGKSEGSRFSFSLWWLPPYSVRKENLPSKIPSFALWGGTWTRLMLDQKLPCAVCSSMPFLVLQCLPGWWDWVGRIGKCLRRQSESWHPSRYYCNMVESRTSQLSLDTGQSVKTISTPVSVVSHLMFYCPWGCSVFVGSWVQLHRGAFGRHLALPLKMLSLRWKRKFIMCNALRILIFNSEVLSSLYLASLKSH